MLIWKRDKCKTSLMHVSNTILNTLNINVTNLFQNQGSIYIDKADQIKNSMKCSIFFLIVQYNWKLKTLIVAKKIRFFFTYL